MMVTKMALSDLTKIRKSCISDFSCEETKVYAWTHNAFEDSVTMVERLPLQYPGVKVPRENACAAKTCGITRILADLRKFCTIRVNGRSGAITRMRH